ncbi:MAG: cytochrome P450, partial [Pseudomonadota bacterium]
MADTSFPSMGRLERPTLSYRAPTHEGYLERGAPVLPADDLDLASIDLADVEIWRQNKMWDRFERLRKEDPVHFTPDSFFGPYWSITKYEDVLAVDTDHKRFSSDAEHGGITLSNMTGNLIGRSFISSDEPYHSAQRKVAQPAVAPTALRDYEPLIRSRTQALLDRLPVNEPFDWVHNVSIELTAMMLATLFNYPQEQRRELTRWSDVTTNPTDPDICPGGMEQWRQELTACGQVFWQIYSDRKNADPGGDLMSMLAHGEATKDLGPIDLLGTVLLLIIGGNDTTRNSMT